MRTYHWAIDQDDVMLDFMGGVKNAVEKEYGVKLGEAEKWELGDLLNDVIGYSWWTWLRKRDWIWPNFDAINGAIGGVEYLRRQGHYVEMVTSKPEWAEAAVWKWLGKWRPPFNSVTIVGSEDRKVDFTKADIMVDDKPSNCLEFIEEGRNALLFAQPHNANETRIRRARNWRDVCLISDELSNVES